MIEALLLAAVPVPAATAIDAERAFAADAGLLGQWTAFRKHAAPGALMFVPQPVKAQQWLRGRADPPAPIHWWPNASFTSCDGRLAVNLGGARRADGSLGHFTTVWQQQAGDQWQWVYDAGHDMAAPFPRPAQPVVRTAACTPIPAAQRLKRVKVRQGKGGYGESSDGSLIWMWAYSPQKIRWFHVELWNGKRFETVIDQQVDQRFQQVPAKASNR